MIIVIKIIINGNKCNGCGECVDECDSFPYGELDICSLENCPGEDCLGQDCKKIKEFAVLKIQNGKVMINNLDGCNGCFECMYICKSFAIFIKDNRPQQNMGPIMQGLQPILHCYYCDNFEVCITCEGKDCINCDLCRGCKINLKDLMGPWFSPDGREIK